MPISANKYSIMISRPSDVNNVNEIIDKVVDTFNNRHKDEDLYFVTNFWCKDMLFGFGPPQGIINEQITNNADAICAFFSKTVGSPTVNHESGTIEEIEKLIENNKQVWVFFYTGSVNLADIDAEKFAELQRFKDKYAKRGIYSEYKDASELEAIFANQLDKYFSRIRTKVVLGTNLSTLASQYNKLDKKIVQNYMLVSFSKIILPYLDIADDIKLYVRCIIVDYNSNNGKPSRKTIYEFGKSKVRQHVLNRPRDFGVVGFANQLKRPILYDFRDKRLYKLTTANYCEEKLTEAKRKSLGQNEDSLALLVAPIKIENKIIGCLSFDFFDNGTDDTNILRLIEMDVGFITKVLHHADFCSDFLSELINNGLLKMEVSDEN